MGRHSSPSTAGDAGDDGDTPPCPYCESTDTVREHPKGPSLCRSINYCRRCQESFEAFR